MKKPAVRIHLAPLRRHNACGLSVPADRTIWVDPREPWPAHTLLHELIHVENPSWSESRVIRETARRWKKLDWKGAAELLQLLGRARLSEGVDE